MYTPPSWGAEYLQYAWAVPPSSPVWFQFWWIHCCLYLSTRKLVVTSATLVVTSALLVVTKKLFELKFIRFHFTAHHSACLIASQPKSQMLLALLGHELIHTPVVGVVFTSSCFDLDLLLCFNRRTHVVLNLALSSLL